MRRPLLIAMIAALVAGGLAASCTLFEDDIPDRSCRSDNDCFRAQGERCNMTTNECELGGPDAAPLIDAAAVAP